MNRPENSEFAPFYSGYVSQIDGTDVLNVLKTQPAELRSLLASVDDVHANFGYAEGKWSLKELLLHINDGERVFGYRAFRIARGDATPLASFDQDSYVSAARANELSVNDLLAEFELLRRSNLITFGRLDDVGWQQMGTASEAAVSVRALAYIMAGHVKHHANIIHERYLP
ncbi:MAG: DinB family protein [Blastocatellia bacterium]|nr:DinB family protein [Blastocatellia bacterium]